VLSLAQVVCSVHTGGVEGKGCGDCFLKLYGTSFRRPL